MTNDEVENRTMRFMREIIHRGKFFYSSYTRVVFPVTPLIVLGCINRVSAPISWLFSYLMSPKSWLSLWLFYWSNCFFIWVSINKSVTTFLTPDSLFFCSSRLFLWLDWKDIFTFLTFKDPKWATLGNTWLSVVDIFWYFTDKASNLLIIQYSMVW